MHRKLGCEMRQDVMLPSHLAGNSWCWKSTTEAKHKADSAAAAPDHQMLAAMRYWALARFAYSALSPSHMHSSPPKHVE